MPARRFLAVLACLAVGCEKPPQAVAPLSQSGELVILTVNGPVTYFEDAQGHPSGLEYDLATLFARELNVTPTFVTTDSPAKIERLLRDGRAHMAAAALPRHFEFPGGLTWGPSYFTTQHQLVWRAADPKPKSLADLAGKPVGVIAESAADDVLASPANAALRAERFPDGTS